MPDYTKQASAGTGTGGIAFSPPLAVSSEFPPPDLGMLPVATAPSGGNGRPVPARAGTTLELAWARNALALVARALACEGRRVLLPAYHCPALVEPFAWARWPILFYPMAPTLEPDMAWLHDHLAPGDALVLVPFFGICATLDRPLALARERGSLVIEDMAHAALKQRLDGDFGVTSLQKFYPVASGAELFVAEGVDAQPVTELWRATMVGESAWHARALAQKIRRRLTPGRHSDMPAPFRYLEPTAIGEPMRARDRRILAQCDTQRVTERRRGCYEQLSTALSGSPLGSPLYPALGAGDVPYVFPFLLHDEAGFRAIRNAALPLYRWEEIAPGHCKTSDSYRRRLVQLPCHQDLSDEDVAEIVARLATLA